MIPIHEGEETSIGNMQDFCQCGGIFVISSKAIVFKQFELRKMM